MGWLKDSLILLAIVLGISGVAMGLQAEPGEGDARGPVLNHLDSCAECRSARGHMDCRVMQSIQQSINRRAIEQNPWVCVIEAEGMPSPNFSTPAAPKEPESRPPAFRAFRSSSVGNPR